MKLFMTLLFLISFCEVKCFFTYSGIGSGYRFFIRKVNQAYKEEYKGRTEIKTKQIEQPIDHFDKHNTNTWKMTYYLCLKYWQPKGPLYFFVGGSGEAGHTLLKQGLMYDLAKETHGAMFATEHRYYGKSYNYFANFHFLNARQAVADLARLVRYFKSKEKYKQSKIIMVGASYAGNLAVWLKVIFPRKVDAVIACSAPLYPVLDYNEYLVQVALNYYEVAPPECWKKIKDRFEDIDDKLMYNYGIEQLVEEENICDNVDMKSPENQQFFYQSQLSIFMACALGGVSDILNSCEAFNDISKVKLLRNLFGNEIQLWNDKRECFDYDFGRYIRAIEKNPSIKAWTYQSCTEFGQFPTTTSVKQPFSNRVPAQFYYLTCSALFGNAINVATVEHGVKYTNFIFGGAEPNVTNVIFVNGLLDPWIHLNVHDDSENKVIELRNVSHATPSVLFQSEDDSEDVKNAKEEIKQQIKIWIGLED